MILPDDLYYYADDYADDRSHRSGGSQSLAGNEGSEDCIAVIDDWPNDIPVTEAEVDVFERYFGDLLERLFGAPDPDPQNQGLPELTSDVNYRL